MHVTSSVILFLLIGSVGEESLFFKLISCVLETLTVSKRLVVGQFSDCKRADEMQQVGCFQISETKTSFKTQNQPNTKRRRHPVKHYTSRRSSEHLVPLHDDIAIPGSRNGPSFP